LDCFFATNNAFAAQLARLPVDQEAQDEPL
jgi:hypothetical protein